MMEAGKLRHRITIESPTRTTSPTSGQSVVAFGEMATVSAEVRPLTARELVRAGQTDVNATHYVSIRYREDVTEQCRITFNGRKLNITSVINVGERNVELQILATETR